MRPTSTPVSPASVLSVLPGRARFRVPSIQGRPALAKGLEQGVLGLPGVRQVRANPASCGVLVRYESGIDPERIRLGLLGVLADAIDAFIDRIELAPAQVPAASGASRPVRADGSEDRSVLARLVARTDRYPELRRRAVAAAIADGIADGIPPLLIGLAVGTVINGPTSLLGKLGFATTKARLLALGGISAGLWGLAVVLEYWKKRTSAELADLVRRDLRNELYDHVQRLDVSTVEGADIAEWMTVLDHDIDTVHFFVRTGMDPLVQIGSNTLIVGATFAIAAPGLGLVQLLGIPPVVYASSRLLQPLKRSVLEERDDEERARAIMSGNLSGIGTLAAFGAFESQATKVHDAVEVHLESSRTSHRLEAHYVPTLRAIVGFGFVTTLVWGGAQAARGLIPAAGLDVLGFTQLRLMAALGRAGVGLEDYQRTSAALERIYRTLDMRASIEGGFRTLPDAEIRGEVVFESVHFGYEEETPIFEGFDLACAAGDTIGIVGSTGSGKSTLLRLLLRFQDPWSGSIRIDGIETRELSLDDLRGIVSMVPQDIVLFAGTIHENIAFGRPDATREEVEEVARIAEAHEFIEALPDGYDSVIGFGGLTLSGGQRQRIAIARALLPESRILVFDEATSALDYETESLIQRSLQSAIGGRTAIIIAHRLSTIRHADRICVLEEGRLVEQGRHDELIAANGLYANMWRVQTGERVGAGD